MRVLLGIALVLLPCSQAFWFLGGNSGRQQAEAEISQECIQKAEDGDCQFYTCFDERHPCTRHNWALSYGWRYCTRYNQEYERFTDDGKAWINNSRICTMQSMLEFYNDEFINCEDVEYAMKDAHSKCESDNGVCDSDMVYENREVLLDIYKISRKGMVRFLLYIRECGGTELDRFLEWMERQREIADPFMDSIKDLLTYIAETDWNVEEWGLEIPEFEVEWPEFTEFDVKWPDIPEMPEWDFGKLSWYARKEADEAEDDTEATIKIIGA